MMRFDTNEQIDQLMKDGGFILTEDQYKLVLHYRNVRGNINSLLDYLNKSTSMSGDKKIMILISYATGHFRYQSGNMQDDSIVTHKVELGYTTDLGMELN